jgi:hypothetical protein
MTAYRQQALACAALLRAGPGRPLDLRAVAPEAGRILLDNVYGWFERTQRGVYRLTDVGEAALQRWPGAVTTLASEELVLRGDHVAVGVERLPNRLAAMTDEGDLRLDGVPDVA